MSAEIGNNELLEDNQPDDFEDAAVRRLRLLRIGARNKDHATLDAVKDDLVGEYGEILGTDIYEELLFHVISDINIEDIKEKHGIDLKHLE